MSNPNSTFSPIPVTIIGGFLGSGKTSLLNHIINNTRGKRFAVLVNDFGEINIDAKLVVSVEGETISLANGCVCCVIRDDLLKEVIRLCERDPLPEHIVIESSGVARPVAVAETFFNPAVQHLVEVQNMITLLDADLAIDEQADYTDLAYAQVAVADLVVINKTDLVPPHRLETVRQKVEAIVPRARIWETTFGEVPLDLIFDDQMSRAMESLLGKNKILTPHNAHDHGGEFATWTFRSKAKWSFNALQRAVEHLPQGIFRAKGMVRLDLDTDDYGILQVTGRRGWLRLVEPESAEDEIVTTELVFIGKPGSTSNKDLKIHFEHAWQAANSQGEEGYTVTDLRAFNVIFT
ncbi:MAG: GTP-binding protein [Deltaproteobacteria bacterium]|nr:GTP-binding protein [Deltaproteobacteria bacterium]